MKIIAVNNYFYNNILNNHRNLKFRGLFSFLKNDTFEKHINKDVFCSDIFQEPILNVSDIAYPEEYLYKNPLNILCTKPMYTILHLYVEDKYKGLGTEAIKTVVRKSLKDKRTCGRVALAALSLDGNRTYPAGFYYKLGFRFCNKEYNDICAEWLKTGGNKDFAPHIEGAMFLPQKNIQHCLNISKYAQPPTNRHKKWYKHSTIFIFLFKKHLYSYS